jgi:hypothetical protein
VEALIVSSNTYNIWQTVLAIVLIVGSVGSLGRWLNGRLPKRSEVTDLKKALAEAQAKNSSENSRIISAVREVKADVRQLTYRLDQHIDKKTEISLDKGTGDE